VYGILLKNEKEVKEVMSQLHQAGVGTRAFFYPMHQQPVLKEMGLFEKESYPVAERLSQKGFYIPSGLALTEAHIAHVSQQLKKILTRSSRSLIFGSEQV